MHCALHQLHWIPAEPVFGWWLMVRMCCSTCFDFSIQTTFTELKAVSLFFPPIWQCHKASVIDSIPLTTYPARKKPCCQTLLFRILDWVASMFSFYAGTRKFLGTAFAMKKSTLHIACTLSKWIYIYIHSLCVLYISRWIKPYAVHILYILYFSSREPRQRCAQNENSCWVDFQRTRRLYILTCKTKVACTAFCVCVSEFT